MTMKTPTAWLVAMAAVGGGCAGLPAAQMALPETLTAIAPETVQGLGGKREGEFVLAGTPGRFERSASRLSLFDDLMAFDRVGASYRTAPSQGAAVAASCRGRQTEATVGVLSGAPRPYEVRCQFSGGVSGEMVLAAPSAVPGTRAERRGSVNAGGVTLALESVHRVQGSPLPLEQPIGYVFTQDGRAVGAIELNGTPRLWRPPAGTPAHDAVTQAALALALLWDPAGR
jgi:hypothetical protein